MAGDGRDEADGDGRDGERRAAGSSRREILRYGAASVAGLSVLGVGTAGAQEATNCGARRFSRAYTGVGVSTEDVPAAGSAESPPEGETVVPPEPEGSPVEEPPGESEMAERLGPGLPGQRRAATAGGRELRVRTSYDGFSYLDTVRGAYSGIPPDSQVAAGPSHAVAAVNSVWGAFDKETGERLYAADLGRWFRNAIEETTFYLGFPYVFDPWLAYDRGAGRFYLLATYYHLLSNTSHWMLSVSDDANPLGGWTNYRVTPIDASGIVDFPKLGYDGRALYLTQNYFGGNLSFSDVTLAVLNKADALAGRTVDAFHFTGLARFTEDSTDFTLQPTVRPSGTSNRGGPFHLLSNRLSTTGQSDSLTLWKVRNPATDPTLSCSSVDVTPYWFLPTAEQRGSEAELETGEGRLANVVTDPADGTLWTVHSVPTDWNGDGNMVDALRWYQVDPREGTVVQSGMFGERGVSYYWPAVAANGDSTVVVSNFSGPGHYLGVSAVGRTRGHEAGRMEDRVTVQKGRSAYDYGGTTMRTGDYSGISVDPETGRYWGVAEYSPAFDPSGENPAEREVDRWRTRIAELSF